MNFGCCAMACPGPVCPRCDNCQVHCDCVEQANKILTGDTMKVATPLEVALFTLIKDLQENMREITVKTASRLLVLLKSIEELQTRVDELEEGAGNWKDRR